MTDIIAERLLLAQSRQSKEKIQVRVTIGRPYWKNEGVEAACPVTFEGIYGRQPDIRGVDLMDALSNALALIESLIDGARRDHELFWPDGEPFEGA